MKVAEKAGHRSIRSAPSIALSSIFLSAAVVLSWASTSLARPEFPEQMQAAMDLDCIPSCLMCHTSLEGGRETLNDYGATKVPRVNFEAAWEAGGLMDTVNSDGVGATDRAEVIANTDPGSADDQPICVDATYGCGARLAPQARRGADDTWPLGAAFAVFGVLVLRLRRSG